ncbi:MAG: S8 family peptidase [Saprospiraceae bacterium]|nr:S8 family peptidase [Saprospiraceae bacterium]
MRSCSIVLLLLVCFLTSTLAQSPEFAPWRSKIAPEILQSIQQAPVADILVVMQEQADVRGARFIKGKAAKAQFVYNQLVATATRSQANALRLLQGREAYVNSYFLVNVIAVRHADLQLMQDLAQLPEVRFIAADPLIPMSEPERFPGPVTERGTIEWGVQKIHAPEVWALGYTGQGITVAGADTGYEWEHPALKAHYRGWNKLAGTANHAYNWHDAIHEINPLNGDSIPDPANNPCGVNSQVPCDDHNHGTHTMGTMVGDDGQDNQIGVAPGAQWVACRNMERGNGQPSTYIECFQWFLAPTDLNNQNPDVSKAPHVINNSWYCSVGEGCTDLTINEMMRQVVINLKAAGVVVVVSNGNFGSSGCNTTYGPPAYFEESFSVGATAINDTITNFSSRGPVTIDGSFRLKPNVVAPGAAVRSSVRFGGYQHFWGTSMAGPHVAGLVALVLSARPDLAGEVDLIEDIIEQTAVPGFDTVDCGSLGAMAYPNNSYGYGRVDALAAVEKALSLGPLGAGEVLAPQVTVFPNPVEDKAVFELAWISGPTQLEVFNPEGKQVYLQTWQAGTGTNSMVVPCRTWAPGVYFWRLTAGNGTAAGSLIKQ